MSAPGTLTVYGIPNCDTVKRACAWLKDNAIAHRFHDFKTAGLDAQLLEAWVQCVGWEPLLNRRGTTWRQLEDAERSAVDGTKAAIALMQRHPSLVKRPVAQWPDGSVTVGFDAATWSRSAAQSGPCA
jgi:arsenate reductase (glutaredoxin)